MIYRFVSKDGLIQRIGDIDCESLEAKLQTWLDEGAEISTAEAWDAQIIGPLNKKIEELSAEKLPVSEEKAE